ncbi:hypothetical protein GGP41_000600 [Bipolaris sorokiniana]|uniref:Uncharacterized protein n=1 Tax=Cochliobolus sativus TaxID=45130 RepID=A0A8H5ZMP1_COCSA|nr:hypothetical protein GGP41_000600 [Bipolaris sorokiniana]
MLGIFDRNFSGTIVDPQVQVPKLFFFFFCLASLELARQDAYSHSFRSGAWVWGRRLWFVRRKGGLDLGVGEQQAHDDELWSIMRWQHISLAPNLER